VLLASLGGRLADARSFALRHRTLLLIASNGVHVDVSLGAMPFEERSVERASLFAISDHDSITTCSAEDLIVHKAFAGRDKDWGDIRGIVARQSCPCSNCATTLKPRPSCIVCSRRSHSAALAFPAPTRSSWRSTAMLPRRWTSTPSTGRTATTTAPDGEA
jgi:hypothetical protein